MKIQGYDGVATKREIVALEREDGGIQVTITALPPSYMDLLAREMPEPIAPLKKIPARDPETQRFLKDPVTGGKIFPPDLDNPNYQREIATYGALSSIAMAYHGLRHDPNIAFDTSYEPNSPSFNGHDFYAAIRDEMENFGFTMGDIYVIVSKVAILSGIKQAEIEKAKEDFTNLNPQEETPTDSD